MNNGLFDSIAKLLPKEQRESYFQHIVYLRQLAPNDEILRVCEAMGFLALITRETPERIADERAELTGVLDKAVQSIQKTQQTTVEFCRKLETRLEKLPGEIVLNVDPKGIAAQIGEGIERSFSSTGLPELSGDLRGMASHLQAATKDFGAVADSFAHPQDGFTTKLNGCLQQLEQRLGSLLRFLETQLQKLRWSMIRGVILLCLGCLVAGVILGLLLSHS